jgi:hypothetical protein
MKNIQQYQNHSKNIPKNKFEPKICKQFMENL